MKYQELKNLLPLELKRFCGVHQETFQQMAKIVDAEKVLQKKSGRPSKYRNKRRRFGLRLNLIAGIYNYELNWQQKLIC
jgi:hypothetical protein